MNGSSSSPRPGARIIGWLESLVFGARKWVVAIVLVGTVVMAYNALQLKMSAGYDKMLPYKSPIIQTFDKYRSEFGGGDRITVALMARRGDIFTPEFFQALEKAHDSIFRTYGVDRRTVHSLFSPNTVFVDIVQGGFTGGRVVPSDFSPTPAMLQRVRTNISKANLVGRLVSSGLDGAVVTVELQRRDPETGGPLDYPKVAAELEALRASLQSKDISVHIIGFAESTAQIAKGAESVFAFFILTVVLVTGLVYWYCRSAWATFATVIASLTAVVWQLGLTNLFGLGMDPLNVLIPFLILAVGTSHAIQMMNGWTGEMLGDESEESPPDALMAARQTFRRLFVPATVALLANVVGFLTLFMIDIPIIQEFALGAMIGMAVIIPIKLGLLPVLLSYANVRNPARFRERTRQRLSRSDGVWRRLAMVTRRLPSIIVVAMAVVLLAVGGTLYRHMQIGDVDQGVPELRADSVYNKDVRVINKNFHTGIDVLTVYAETRASGCIKYPVMSSIDSFVVAAKDLPGVLAVDSLSELAIANWVGYHEGNPKWHALPHDSASLVLTTAYVEQISGLLNADCSVMPINIFLANHRADTVSNVVNSLRQYAQEHPVTDLHFAFAGGNVGAIYAANKEVAAREMPMLLGLFVVIFLLCLLTYRQPRMALCIVAPLILNAFLVNGIMVLLGVGLKVNTLPVAAIGVGIAVDYGIYICSMLSPRLRAGMPMEQAYYETLKLTGKAVIFISTVLALGVFFWVFSELKFQSDMGMLLGLTFVLNGISAIFLLPVLLRLLRVDVALRKSGPMAGMMSH